MLAKGIVRLFRRHMLDRLLDENQSGPGRRFLRNGGVLEWPKMIDRMMEGDFGFMRQAGDDWLLALDDIGAEHEKLRELSASKLFAILNARQFKFTVLTANLGIEEIADKLDPRIASRLLRHGGVVIDTTGIEDWNMRTTGRQAA